jgi:hypothetical protein
VAKRLEGTDGPRSRGAPRSAAGEDFNPDYSYVRSDLRRIAYLAGAFLSLLVILSFLID